MNQNNQFHQFQQFHQQPPRRRKSRLLAVLFGLLPGAGHMYLGKMNRGLSLMALFFGSMALGVIFPPILFILPLVWFYAFFDALNLSGLSEEQRDAQPDELGFGLLDTQSMERLKKRLPVKNLSMLCGWALIIMGGYMLYQTLLYRIVAFLESVLGLNLWWLESLLERIPQLLLSVGIIWLGLRLIRSGTRTEEPPHYRPTASSESRWNAPQQPQEEKEVPPSILAMIRAKTTGESQNPDEQMEDELMPPDHVTDGDDPSIREA